MATTDFRDYYAILGVAKGASGDEIKRTYRRLARKYHPDLNPGNQQAEARFKEINEAYEVLSDPSKRKKYDQFGRYWQQADRMGGGAAGGWPGGAAAGNGGFEDFEFGRYGSFDDFINELLGRFGNAGPTGRSPGASAGRSAYSSYRAAPGGGAGAGFSGFGNDFSGAGFNPQGSVGNGDREASITLSFAEAFNGTQKRLSVGGETINVRIPPGAKPGSKIRLRGKGDPTGYGSQRGDLYLKVNLTAHEFFEFEGDNLICELPLAPDEAVLGAKVEVPTPDGLVTVSVPPGIRSGQSLRLRGKGWVKSDGSRSDQVVRVAIATPKDPTMAEREAYEQVRAARKGDPRSHFKQIKL
ncbi:MAG: DnaJ C-terminal domain-containing protein [Cyanophyceae cyanobacterium]